MLRYQRESQCSTAEATQALLGRASSRSYTKWGNEMLGQSHSSLPGRNVNAAAEVLLAIALPEDWLSGSLRRHPRSISMLFIVA